MDTDSSCSNIPNKKRKRQSEFSDNHSSVKKNKRKFTAVIMVIIINSTVHLDVAHNASRSAVMLTRIRSVERGIRPVATLYFAYNLLHLTLRTTGAKV